MRKMTRRTFALASLAMFAPLTACAKGVDTSSLDDMSADELRELLSAVQAKLDEVESKQAKTDADASKQGTETVPIDFQTMTAEEIILQMKADGMPIDTYEVTTAENDSNGLLGRPNSYTSKINFNDITLGYDPTFSVSNGGSIEVFTSEADAQSRATYVSSFNGTALGSEYDYVSGHVLLRLAGDYTPEQAAQWESELNAPAGNALGTGDGSGFQLMQLAEQNWHWYDNGYTSYAVWAAVANNPNDGLALNYVSFAATAYAEDGTVLGSDEHVLKEAWPSSSVAAGGTISTNGAVPARVEVVVKGGSLADNWHTADLADRPHFEVVNLAETQDSLGFPVFTGSIGNYEATAVNVAVTVITRTADGALVDVATSYVNNVPAQSWQDFTVSAYYDLAAHDQIEGYAEEWY